MHCDGVTAGSYGAANSVECLGSDPEGQVNQNFVTNLVCKRSLTKVVSALRDIITKCLITMRRKRFVRRE